MKKEEVEFDEENNIFNKSQFINPAKNPEIRILFLEYLPVFIPRATFSRLKKPVVIKVIPMRALTSLSGKKKVKGTPKTAPIIPVIVKCNTTLC